MWASVVHMQAKSEQSVWPFILGVSVVLLIFHVISSSQWVIRPMVLGRQESSTIFPVLAHNNPMAIDDVTLPPLELPMAMVTALRHSQRTVLRDLQNLQPALDPSKRLLIRGLIVSTWRSGATFLGEALTAHPGAYYHSEPLNWAWISRFTQLSDPQLGVALTMIKSLFQCDYSYIKDKWPRWPYRFHYAANVALRGYCGKRSWKYQPMCTDPVFLNALCSIYPVHFMKTVRLAVNLTRPLLLDRTFDDVKVLYLVRDPRATLNSRKSRDFCAATPSCIKAESLCSDLVDDFYSLIELQNAFPGRIKVLRYEEMAVQQKGKLREVANFFGIEVQQTMRDYVFSRADPAKVNRTQQEPWSTYRDPKLAATHWMKEMQYDEVEHIQHTCHLAMRLWGYKEAHDEFDLFHLDPVLPMSHLIN